ncbi:MAG: penicillin acylase family protein, partial [Bacteroidota bacterium]
SNDMKTFLGLMKSKNYTDYETAISTYSCPAQNFVFASVSGDIAIWQMGDYVNRWPEQGRFILDGTRKDHDWQGEIPWQQHPHVFNPREGHVSSANQHPTSPLYPYYYNGRFASYRGRRIKNLLNQNDSLSSADLKAFQLDNHNLMAEDVLPLMLTELDSLPLNPQQVKVKNLLTSWNFDYEGDLVAPSLFEAWWRDLYYLIWQDEFGDAEVALRWPSSSTTVGLLRDSVVQRFYRTPSDTSLKTRTQLVQRSFQTAVDSFFARYPNEDDWLWQKRQGTDIRHLARVVSSFHRAGLPTNGTANALNAITRGHGPSWRMVVELGPQPKAYGIYPGGQSGNPGDKGYDQFIDDWVEGNYYPLWLMRDANDIRDSIQSKVVFK